MKDLIEFLELHLPEMVAVVGSGGKTSFMFGLAGAMEHQGAKVITTTTTKIFVPNPDQSPAIVLSSELGVLLAKVQTALESHGHVTMALSQNADNKLIGLPPELIDHIYAEVDADLVLIEADGARGLPLKGPGPGEPVIPAEAGLVVPMVGLGGLGRPMGEDTVFRPERFAKLTGLTLGDPITAESIAAVMFHRHGLCRDVPERARIIPFLNQADLVDGATAETAARVVYEAAPPTVERVVWGSLQNPEAGFQTWPRD